MAYIVRFEKKAVKALEKMPPQQRLAIIEAATDLGTNPRPHGYKKLKGVNGYRLRVGDYRIIYDVNDKEIRITIVKIGHRKYIYE